ncbi:MAG: hypothetical protein JWM35_851, partial [Verrucomicrobia bacterium]|nr:hypothetical protein [Verrucomicrobiota bacterium]
MNRPKFPLLASLLLAAVTFLAGCGTGVKPDSVTVSVANVKATHLNATDLSVTVVLRFTSESLNAFGF